jgi:hypothetical protein
LSVKAAPKSCFLMLPPSSSHEREACAKEKAPWREEGDERREEEGNELTSRNMHKSHTEGGQEAGPQEFALDEAAGCLECRFMARPMHRLRQVFAFVFACAALLRRRVSVTRALNVPV